MIATIKTSDPELINKLQKAIKIVQEFKGFINRSYTIHQDYMAADQEHKAALFSQLKPLVDEHGLLMGTGGGHIWIALPSAYNISDRTPLAVNVYTTVSY